MPDFDGSPLTISCKYAQNFVESVRLMVWELDGLSDCVNNPVKNKFGGYPCNINLEKILG